MLGSIIYFILGCYGVTTIIVQSKIFKPVRKLFESKLGFLGSMINCMICSGFWVSLSIGYVLGFSPSELLYTEYVSNTPELLTTIIIKIFDSALIASTLYHIYIIELYIESKLPDER